MKLLLRLFGLDHELLHEDFEAPELPEGWTREIAAHLDRGPEAIVEARDGALRLEVHPGDRVFPALARDVDVQGLDWVRVSARMKTEAVDPEPAVYDNCNLYVRFDEGPVQPLRVLIGDQPWTQLSRTYAVPPGARRMRVGLVLTMPGVAWFDDVKVEAVRPGWRSAARGRFVFHTLGRDRVSAGHQRRMLEAAAEFEAFFGVSPERVDYWKYPDIPTKIEFTGIGGNGHALGSAIHTIWPVERHELVHVYANAWGPTTPLWGEGLAVWLSGDWLGKPVKEAAKAVLDRWVSIAELLDPYSFRACEDTLSYAIAGALVGWVLETRGQETLRVLYRGDDPTPVLGCDPEAIDAMVRAWLD